MTPGVAHRLALDDTEAAGREIAAGQRVNAC